MGLGTEARAGCRVGSGAKAPGAGRGRVQPFTFSRRRIGSRTAGKSQARWVVAAEELLP